ncbi:MAG: CZB domain-containing protein, partial [Thermodesulfobacteriota bacterium]|nr:CZB domain-containing protein [Thermodesulfobacteriota bacterium]
MKWDDLTIGKKVFVGFGVVSIMLVVVVVIAYSGVRSIVGNAGQVINGNKLDGILAQKELDHLSWAGKVNALLTDNNITELDVQTDDHQCSFGKWLYGEERKEAEKLVPKLAPFLKEIEEPHRMLHESAIAIDTHFEQSDPTLPAFLAAKELDLLKWVVKVNEIISKNLPEFNVITDDHECPLGKWLHGEGSKKIISGNAEFAKLIEPLKESHKKLHQSAIEIQNVYKKMHPGLLIKLSDRLSDIRLWVIDVAGGIIANDKELTVELDPTRCLFGRFLSSEKTAEMMKDFPALKASIEASKT